MVLLAQIRKHSHHAAYDSISVTGTGSRWVLVMEGATYHEGSAESSAMVNVQMLRAI